MCAKRSVRSRSDVWQAAPGTTPIHELALGDTIAPVRLFSAILNPELSIQLRSCIGKDCLSLDLEDDFELYRHPKWQTRDTNNEPNRYFLAAEYIAKEIRDRVRHPGLIKEVSGGSDEYADSHYAHHLVERPQVLFCSGQSAESGGVGGIPSSLDVEFFAEAAEIL